MDRDVQQIESALAPFAEEHPDAVVEVRRYNPSSVRVRVIDCVFEGMRRADREKELWRYLEPLPDDVFTQVTMLLPLAPQEKDSSLASYEFDHPVPSRL